MLNIEIQNLGNIKEAKIELGKLTIFAGPNNSGKTYINYLLYALLNQNYSIVNKTFLKFIEKAKNDGVIDIELDKLIDEEYLKIKAIFEKNFEKSLDRFFSAENGTFSKFNLKIIQDINEIKENIYKTTLSRELKIGKDREVLEISKKENSNNLTLIIKDSTLPNDIYLEFLNDAIFKIIFYELVNDTFLLPAERTGINLFYQELNIYRNSLINNLQKSKIDPVEILEEMMVSKYPQPIADYINFLNSMHTLKKRKSELKKLNEFLHKKIINGKYKIDKDGSIYFLPYKTSFKGRDYRNKIDLHLSSSTAKTFFSLEFYIEHIAKKDSFLIIDEPELNLHSDNQRNVARLLACLVNNGVNVIISTHSDYIIREFNNLIMLKEDFKNKEELMQKYGYSEEELLNLNDIKAYLVDNGKVELMSMNNKEGIIANTFDEVINALNTSSDDIYYTKLEEIDDE